MELDQLYKCLDITSLNAADDEAKMISLARSTLYAYEGTNEQFLPAAICVFPNWLPVVRDICGHLPMQFAVVSGGFPLGQTLPQVKMLETHAAVEKGATEIDMVINRGLFLSGKHEDCGVEIKLLKDIAGDNTLKVIIETSDLKTEQNITGATVLALHVGADFVKTSTGKGSEGATMDGVKAICAGIADYYSEMGIRKGIKISGGVSNVEVALQYAEVVKECLHEDWLVPELFRIGSSGLANDILTEANYKDLASF